jgi:hypothetical protein
MGHSYQKNQKLRIVLTKKSTIIYKDLRFWLVVGSLFILAMTTLYQYPIG